MEKFKSIMKELYPYIIIILVVVLIRTFLVTPVTVQGPSMNETLNNGDLLLLTKYNKNDIKRDDVIVFKKGNDELIKRVLALPGEKIKCVSGVIYVNNEEYNDSHAFGKTEDFKEYILNDDEYFVVGDNRENSYDSRFFGPIKKEYIKGIASLRIFPFNKITSL